jgi:branched-subunit amino acid ABC-type transport system permease component
MLSGGLVLQAVVAGIAAGAVSGLVAVGFSLVYRLSSVLQLAHGHLVGGASFLMIALAFGTGPAVAGGISAARYLVAALVVLAGSALAGVVVYVVAVRPSRGSATRWIGATAAIALAIDGVLASVFPRDAYALPDALPFARWAPVQLPGDATLSPRVVYVAAVGLVVAALFRAIVARTDLGAAWSAIASEPVGAALVGLPVERLLAVAFGVAGVLAGVSGLLGAPDAGSVGVSLGALVGVKAIAAAIVGGFVDLDRVYLAALGLGVAESCVATLLPHGAGAGWRDLTPLLLAVLVLVIRPPAAARELVV